MANDESQSWLGSFKASLLGAFTVILFLIWLIYIQKPAADELNSPSWVLFLPTLNAIANALSAVFLVRAVFFIKKGLKEKHKRNIYLAFAFSALFLAGYVTFYTFHADRKFGNEGLLRFFYLGVLLSHILMSILSLPLILYSLSLGLQEKWQKHRAWAKWTFPMWLYVSVTGVLVHILFSIFSTG
jgi:putative membrane protein